MTPEMLPVEQVDRDAVQAFHAIQIKRILAGDKTLGDDKGDAGVLVQAFARHRLATRPAIDPEALERLRVLSGKVVQGDWRVCPLDGKPIITSLKGGNLFRGYIATWKEAELVVAAVAFVRGLLGEGK